MRPVLVISQACFTAINREVYNQLAARGWPVSIVIPKQLMMGGRWHEAQPQRPQDVPIYMLPTRNHRFARLQTYEGLGELLDRLQPGIVYLDNDPVSRQAVEIGGWCQRNKARLICQSCENLSFGFAASYRRSGIKGLGGSLFKQSLMFLSRGKIDHVFTINLDGKKLFEELGFKSVSRIPLGFDPSVFYPDAEGRRRIREKLGLTQVAVAYFGRMVPEKGVHILLQSLARLKDLDWKLLLDHFSTYKSSYQQQIEALIEELGLKDRVVFFDANHYEIAAYMNAADVVVVPSLSTPRWVEQYGRVAPEAMACGKLVIASRTGALPELIGEAGMLVEEGQTDKLSAVLRELIVSPQKIEQYSSAAQQRAHRELSLHQQVLLIEEIFKKFSEKK